MDAINTRNAGQTMQSFEEFCQDIDLKVKAVCKDKMQRSFDGWWDASIKRSTAYEVHTVSYQNGMKKIYESVIQTNSSPDEAPFGIMESMKSRLLLNLIMTHSDKGGHIADDDRSKIAAYAIKYNVTIDLTSSSFKISNKVMMGEMEKIAREIEATKELVKELTRLIQELKQNRDGLGPTFKFDSDGRWIPDLPLKPHAVYQILCHYSVFVNLQFYNEKLYLDEIFHCLVKIPSLDSCLLDFNKFLLRMNPRKVKVGWVTKRELIHLLPLYAQAAHPIDLMHACWIHCPDKENRVPGSEEDLLYRTCQDLFNSAAEKAVETDPLSLDCILLRHMSKELIEQAAIRGNKDAAIGMAMFKYKPEMKLESFRKGIRGLYYPINQYANIDSALLKDLILLGEHDAWRYYPPSLNDSNEKDILEAISKDPSLVDLNESLKKDPKVQQLLIKKAQKGDLEAWWRMPAEQKNIINVLRLLKNIDELPHDLYDSFFLHGHLSIEAFEAHPISSALIEMKVRQGKQHYYSWLNDEQKQDRELIVAAVTANPLIYEEMMNSEVSLKRHGNPPLNSCPYVSDREIVTIYLKAFSWKAERVLMVLKKPSWMTAAIRFAEIVLMSDGYLKSNESIDKNTKSFYDIATRIPMELQMVLAAKASESEETIIRADDFEWAAAFILKLREDQSAWISQETIRLAEERYKEGHDSHKIFGRPNCVIQ